MLGAVKLRELTADHVDDWLADRKKVLATSSLKVCLSILHRAISLAARRNEVIRNVAALVDVPTGQKGRPSKAMTFEFAKQAMDAEKRARILISHRQGAERGQDPPRGAPVELIAKLVGHSTTSTIERV